MPELPREAGGPTPAAPSAPPTPPVPLAALGLRLLAGPEGAERAEVHGVHASEMADPSPYLLGGELLLTAGAWSGDPEEYVARLARAGVAALGFGVAPVHEEVPPGLAEACGRYGLPLVEVPPGTPFTVVARTVWRLMAEARTRELRRVTEAQQSLAAAAARPDPVPAVLARLSASLGGHVALWPNGPTAGPPPTGAATPGGGAAGGSTPATGTAGGPGGGRAVGAGAGGGTSGTAGAGRGGGPVVEALEVLSARVGRPGGPATATDQVGGWHLAAYSLGPGAALGTATPARNPGDHTVASVAAVLLSLLTAVRPGGDEAAALTRMLLGASPAGVLAPGPWYVVHARGAADPHALAAALGTVLLDARGDDVRLLTEREPTPQPGWRLGVSGPAGPEALAAADAQARRALQRADAARTPLARHADRGFAGLVGEAEARAHAEALLAPLGPALRATLRAWLAHHGSWDRTAAALGVHRNTVRQRIARCATLLDRDLDDPDTRMELWFALRQDPEA
ncbi:PucR family transcriptional regulator [Streptomyces sp. NPDC096339]|uniref:PucR family transcriptional regulator n=1 Tax=Streptomyces sp. NPDC096339 TaxID=3366086 RepID=UPI0037FBB7D4